MPDTQTAMLLMESKGYWEQLELTPPHLTYLILSLFLITYALFTSFIRNRLHLSEPPLAMLVGILLGPYVLDVITPRKWGLEDNIMQEVTRVIVGIQCFVVGIELPKSYFHRHWRSVAMMLGPVMAFGWLVSAAFAQLLFKCGWPAALVIGACLSPTDPVLAASVLAKSRFSDRVPARLKNMLSAESASNDGISFPFLYVGLAILTESTTKDILVKWFVVTILYQCVLGVLIGLSLGYLSKRALVFSVERELVGRPSFIVFYLLMALLSIGVGSTLGSDDFLVAFGAGVGFGYDNWFSDRLKAAFPEIVDLLLNSTMFVYFGADIRWDQFIPNGSGTNTSAWRLVLFVVLVLLFRRIPIVLALKRWIPDLKTYREALFCGHFGPMGVGALFLAIESRAQLETGSSEPLPKPPRTVHGYPDYQGLERMRATELVWPVICAVVFGSTIVHGVSVGAITIASHFSKDAGERAPLLAQEEDGLDAMNHSDGDGDSALEDDEENA